MVHEKNTAAVLKGINPTHVRLRTLWIYGGAPLEELRLKGEFEQLEEEEIVSEIQSMLRGMRGIDGRIVSDHDLNLLGEIEGHLTDDADELDKVCQKFLDLSPEHRDAFVVARRSGYFRSLRTFLADPRALSSFVPVAIETRKAGGGSLMKGIVLRMARQSI
jgi:hypothetical protein